MSCEVEEPDWADPAFETFPCAPADLARLAPPGRIVHVHATRDWPALLAGFKAAPRPFVVTAHDCTLISGGCVYPAFCPGHAEGCPDPCPREYPGSARARALKSDLVRAARPVVASPSSWLAGLLRREWPAVPVKVIPNGVGIPQELADKSRARASLGISPAARVALFLAHGGVRAAYKGGDRIRTLFERIAALVPGALGVVAGGEKVGRGEGLLYLPYLEGELLSLVFRACDALVYPSLADNHPLVVLEAMAHGLPVAAYAVGGIPEQVKDGETGRLVSAFDEEMLAQALAAILSDPALARAMGENARERAFRHFSSDRMASDYDRLYILAGQGRSG